MKKIKIAFLSLLATCTIASCDFLEKEPYKVSSINSIYPLVSDSRTL